MGLSGKLVAAIEFKAGGDLFHQFLRHKPHHVTHASPDKVHGCDLHEGQFGQVGSILSWNYVHDGKDRFAKVMVKKVDEQKKLIEFKILEGDLMQKYRTFIVRTHTEESKRGLELVTWVLEYEKLDEDIEEPISLLDFFIGLTKDIEAHHVGKHEQK